MKFDSIFDVTNILDKIGFDEFIQEIAMENTKSNEDDKNKNIEDRFKDQFPLLAKSAIKVIIKNLLTVREEVYVLLEKETGFKENELKEMDIKEVFLLIKEIFKDGIPDIVLKNLKKTL